MQPAADGGELYMLVWQDGGAPRPDVSPGASLHSAGVCKVLLIGCTEPEAAVAPCTYVDVNIQASCLLKSTVALSQQTCVLQLQYQTWLE